MQAEPLQTSARWLGNESDQTYYTCSLDRSSSEACLDMVCIWCVHSCIDKRVQSMNWCRLDNTNAPHESSSHLPSINDAIFHPFFSYCFFILTERKTFFSIFWVVCVLQKVCHVVTKNFPRKKKTHKAFAIIAWKKNFKSAEHSLKAKSRFGLLSLSLCAVSVFFWRTSFFFLWAFAFPTFPRLLFFSLDFFSVWWEK